MPEPSTQQKAPVPSHPAADGEAPAAGQSPFGRLLRSPLPNWAGVAAAGIVAAGLAVCFASSGGGDKVKPKRPPAAVRSPKGPPALPPAGPAETEDAAFDRMRAEAWGLSVAGDFDGALARLERPPEKFAAALAPRLEVEREAVRKRAEEALGAAMADARKLAGEGRPADALAKLDAAAEVNYAPLAARLAECRSTLEPQLIEALRDLFRASGKAAPVKTEEPPRGPVVYTQWPFDEAEAKRRQKETADSLGLPVETALDLGAGVKLELVLIPAGEFMMGGELPVAELVKRGGEALTWPGPGGAEHEFPRHKARIARPFYLGKYEVTQEQWEKVTGNQPSWFKGMKRPVEQVTHIQSQDFMRKLSERFKGKVPFRLPLEAEWEHACRAGTATPFPFGDKIATDLANYDGEPWDGQGGTNRGETLPVGSFKPNPWGLYDMIGNVWEWCEDPYEAYGEEARKSPRYGTFRYFRVARGGSWYDIPMACRSASRGLHCPQSRYYFLGLRVAVVVPARVR